MVFIPGDWAYIKNAAFRPGQDQGYEGENLIAVGEDRFWGHLSTDQILSFPFPPFFGHQYV